MCTEHAASVRGRAFRAVAIACLGHEPGPFASLPDIVTHWNDSVAETPADAVRKLQTGARMIRARQAKVERGIRDQRFPASEGWEV